MPLSLINNYPPTLVIKTSLEKANTFIKVKVPIHHDLLVRTRILNHEDYKLAILVVEGELRYFEAVLWSHQVVLCSFDHCDLKYNIKECLLLRGPTLFFVSYYCINQHMIWRHIITMCISILHATMYRTGTFLILEHRVTKSSETLRNFPI